MHSKGNHKQNEKTTHRDFPGGPVVKNLPSNAGDVGLIPGRGTKIPHAMGQLNPHATTTEPACSRARAPQLESPGALEPVHHNYRAHTPQLESPRATTTDPVHSGACMPQLERSPCT